MPAVKLQLAKAASWSMARRAVCRRGHDGVRLHQPADKKEGWFKVVTDAGEARGAIAKGQLAVVLGIEEASLFGCKAGDLHTRHRAGDGQ